MTCLVLLNVGSAGAWWTTFPRSAGTSYSLSYAWEKVWQGTGLRSDKCPLQAVYRPRITGWSCSPSFANTALPTIFSIASWLPVSLVVHFHRQCAPSSFLHSQILPVSPWTALLAFLFYFYHYTFSCHVPSHQTWSFSISRHFPGEALPIPLPWAASMFWPHDSTHQWLLTREC